MVSKIRNKKFLECHSRYFHGFSVEKLGAVDNLFKYKMGRKETQVKDLWFGGQFGPIKEMKCSQSANDIGNKIFKEENKEILEKSNKILKREKKRKRLQEIIFRFFVVDKRKNLR